MQGSFHLASTVYLFIKWHTICHKIKITQISSHKSDHTNVSFWNSGSFMQLIDKCLAKMPIRAAHSHRVQLKSPELSRVCPRSYNSRFIIQLFTLSLRVMTPKAERFPRHNIFTKLLLLKWKNTTYGDGHSLHSSALDKCQANLS